MNAEFQHTPEPSDEISLAELYLKAKQAISFLWKRKLLILSLSFLGSVAGYFYAKMKTPEYAANLTFALEEADKSGGLSGLASQFGLSMGGSAGGMFSGDNLLSLMKSRKVLEEVLLSPVEINGKPTLLIDQYISTSQGMVKKWKKKALFPFVPQAPLTFAQDSALGTVIKVLQKTVTVAKTDKKLSIVSIGYTGHDEQFTYHFTNQLADITTAFYLETKTSKTIINLNKLARRTDSVQAALEQEMAGYASQQDQNQFVVVSAAKVSGMKKQLKVTMLTTLYGELVKNLELQKTLAAREEPLIQIIDRPHFPLLVRKSKLQAALVGGFLMGFLTVSFLGARSFFGGLQKEAALLENNA